MLLGRNRFCFETKIVPHLFTSPCLFFFYDIKSVFADFGQITRLKVVVFAASHHVAVTLLVFSQLFFPRLSSVFLIPSQCSLSPLPSLAEKKWVRWWWRGWKGEGWRFLVHRSSPLPGSCQTSCVPISLAPSEMMDLFVLNELLILRLNFWNLHSSHVRTQAHPLTADLHIMSLIFFFSYTTTQCQFLFPRQPFHQSLMVLPPRV